MKKLHAMILVALTIVASVSESAVAGGVGAFLNSLGTMYRSNLSVSPTTYHMSDQTAYTTLGSLALRSPSQASNMVLFNITEPSFHIGCDGIDLNTGGLYFIQDPKILIDRLTSYGTTAIYGMLISLKSSIPVIGNALEWIEGVQEEFNKYLRDGCQQGKALGKNLRTELASWFNSEDEKKRIASGAPADKAHEDAKKSAAVVPFNLTYTNMAGHSKNAARLMMSLMGTIIINAGATNEELAPKPYDPIFSVEEYVTGTFKDNGHNFEYACVPDGPATVPEFDPQSATNPCLKLTKVTALTGNQDAIRKEYEDMIMAMLYISRFAQAEANPGGVTVNGNPLTYYMHGRSVAELHGTMLTAGAAMPRLLKMAALNFNPATPEGWAALYNKFAVPLAPLVAIHHIRYLVSDLHEKTRGSWGTFIADVPPKVRDEYERRTRNILDQTYHYERTIQAQIEASMQLAEQYERALKEATKKMKEKAQNSKAE